MHENSKSHHLDDTTVHVTKFSRFEQSFVGSNENVHVVFIYFYSNADSCISRSYTGFWNPYRDRFIVLRDGILVPWDGILSPRDGNFVPWDGIPVPRDGIPVPRDGIRDC